MLKNEAVQTPLKIMLVEDDRLLLTSLGNMLHARGYGIVGLTPNATAAIDYFDRVRPDCVIIDFDLGPGPSGVDLAIALRAKHPMVGIVICTSIRDERILTIPERMKSNFYYLHKNSVTRYEVLESAINESVRLICDPDSPQRELFLVPKNESKVILSPADLKLLKALSMGLSNKSIAQEKGINLKSCENAIARLAKKLKVPHESTSNQRILLVRKYFEFMGKIEMHDI